MNILLDTHIFIWWSDSPELLSPSALELLEDPTNDLFLSIASAWEMQIKINLGKLTPKSTLPEMIGAQISTNGLNILDIGLPEIF